MLPKPVRTRGRDEKGRRPRVSVDLGDRTHDKMVEAIRTMKARYGYSEVTVSEYIRLAVVGLNESLLGDAADEVSQARTGK